MAKRKLKDFIQCFFILNKIKKYKDIHGWLTENEAIGLYSTAKKVKTNSIVVEIGSWQGKSTFCIAKGLKSGKIYAIDPFNADAGFDEPSAIDYLTKKGNSNLLDIFLNNIKTLKVANKIIIKKGYSIEFNQEFGSIDFLFIDGDHSIKGCKSDYDLYANKIVKGGFIALHDYYDDRPELGPTFVVNQIIKKSGDFAFFKAYDSLWIGVKK